MINNSKNKLPTGWEWTSLENVADILDSQRVPVNAKERESRQGDVPYYGATGQVGFIDDYLFDEELVLLGEDGAPFFDPTKQKAYIIRGKSWVNNHAHVLRTKAGIPSSYLKYYLDIVDYHGFVTGTTRAKLNQKAMRQIPVSLAPPEQQKRIVAEIEKQFSRLDEAVANLKRVKANLKRYKAAVLKAAVEGKLTEEWRKQHPDVEPADKLLERISKEREDRFQESFLEWQDVVTGWEAGGKEDKKPAKPRKPKDLSALGESELSGLTSLPSCWAWTRLGNLNVDVFDGPFGSNLKSSDYVDDGVRVIRLENIGPLEFVDEKVSFITEEKYAQLKKHTVGAGDLIFSSFVADGTRVVMLPDHVETAINKADCFCVRIFGETVRRRYLETFLATRTAYEQLVTQVHGATRPRINTTQLKDCPVSLPPVAEQSVIIDELTRKLSVVEVLETELGANILRADRLRQSVLEKAFSGKLVSNR